jgi:hypothetical protein
MNICKACLAALVSLTLFGCEKPDTEASQKISKVTYESYEIVYINPPKHYSVNLRHLKTGHVFENTAGRKHCNRWREAPVGTIISVKTYHYDNNTFALSSGNAAYTLCG